MRRRSGILPGRWPAHTARPRRPPPEQVSWYIEDADVVAGDVGPGPYSIQKLEAQGNFTSVLVINDWLCGAEEGEGFISLSPISKLPPRQRVITTAEELDALKLPAIIDSPSGGPAKVEYYAGPGRQKYVEPLFCGDDGDEESYSLTFFATFGLPAVVLKERAGIDPPVVSGA